MSNVDLNDQLEELKSNIVSNDISGIELDGNTKQIVFISFGNLNDRAFVCNTISSSLDESWEKAVEKVLKKIKKERSVPTWIKADIVTEVHEYSLQRFIQYISGIKTNYFREGISFDSNFMLAFLEQEVNSNVFIQDNKKARSKTLSWKNIDYYIKRNTGLSLSLGSDIVHKIYTFKTTGAFHDGKDCYQLGSSWLDNGYRNYELNPESLMSIIDKSSKFLADQVHKNGKFRYGYFPCFDKEIDHYNMLRHASTTYSMIEAYELTRSERLKDSIKCALNYLLTEGIKTIKDEHGVEKAFVVEETDNNAIKLGANAAALLAMSKYTEVFSDKKYLTTMNALAEGIAHFQRDDGSFVHVLNYPDLSIREEYRIIYYDGEAAFALMRLYSIDKKQKWLELVEKAFENFINNKYWKHNDHWLSYCSYELFLHRPEQKYLEFNLNNAEGILDFCLTRETTFPTLLELLMATDKIINNCYKQNLYTELLVNFDTDKLNAAISHRTQHQLNGFMFPEVAMYFKVPKNILWGFYIRHHSFRVRIDDIEHNISGYCSYYNKITS